MQLNPIAPKYLERSRKAFAKWNALHPTRERGTVEPLIPFAPAPIPESHCQADPGCPFPPLREGRCRQHARDAIAEASPVGTAHALMREYGLVEPAETQTRQGYRRRCRKEVAWPKSLGSRRRDPPRRNPLEPVQGGHF
jgi:hypothetical protein